MPGYQSPIFALDVNVTGVNIATSGTSASASIPNNSAGVVARYIRIEVTAAAHVRVTKGASSAVATDTLVVPGGGGIVLNCSGCDTVSAI